MPKAVKSLMVIEFNDTSQPYDRLVGVYGREVFGANIHYGKLVMYASPENEFGGLVKAPCNGLEAKPRSHYRRKHVHTKDVTECIPLFLTPHISANTPQFLLPVSMIDENLRNAYYSLLQKKDKMTTNNDNANDNANPENVSQDDKGFGSLQPFVKNYDDFIDTLASDEELDINPVDLRRVKRIVALQQIDCDVIARALFVYDIAHQFFTAENAPPSRKNHPLRKIFIDPMPVRDTARRLIIGTMAETQDRSTDTR